MPETHSTHVPLHHGHKHWTLSCCATNIHSSSHSHYLDGETVSATITWIPTWEMHFWTTPRTVTSRLSRALRWASVRTGEMGSVDRIPARTPLRTPSWRASSLCHREDRILLKRFYWRQSILYVIVAYNNTCGTFQYQQVYQHHVPCRLA